VKLEIGVFASIIDFNIIGFDAAKNYFE